MILAIGRSPAQVFDDLCSRLI